MDECWYEQRKTKENPPGKNTQMVKGQRKRDEEAGVHEGVAGKRQQNDGEFMVGTHPLFMSRPRGRSKSLGERSGEGIGGRDGSTLT